MKKTDLISYPFLSEDGFMCDHEVLTDHLVCTISLACSKLQNKKEKEFLNNIAVCVYHINGSIRGKLGIENSDLDYLYKHYIYYYNETKDIIDGFLLPSGCETSCILHKARCEGKNIVRNMHKIAKDGTYVDQILFDYVNLLSNTLFVLAVFINHLNGVTEQKFISKSY